MRRLILILLVVNGLLLPASCLPFLVAANSVNPLALAFNTAFTVENATAETLRVTPVGTVGPEGRRSPLPMMLLKFPYLPASRLGGFEVPSGKKITLYYDWDDINFSELIFEDASGNLGQLVVDPTPTEDQYSVPDVMDFRVEDFGSLDPVGPRVRSAWEAAREPAKFWPIVGLCLLPLLSFAALSLAYFNWLRRRARPGLHPGPGRAFAGSGSDHGQRL